ncbi:FSR family fosmidomycin resistance protein-like MFS transporter [Thermolongibacillus altinsuensis]|uniref:FSR family fosmidomycin resistance protein-like MFS transporter n=1 Tax=Thermolongibacillus altinsuensis TaxID=575256 RepID=A0A4R1QHX1_9BACL|nr:MFS transporter [Thermolongibacillus altinsuensis]TCL49799.1 FSR family fosmidomycin resistance protein-like MFS transporter [Thermolongibacillus altinsuensis]
MQISVQNQTTLQSTVYRILIAISIGHMLNDSMQAVIPAMFPILERSMHLSYTEIGWMAFTLNMTSSVMQPVVGFFTDKKPSPYFLPLAMGASLIGMIGLAFSSNYLFILISILFVGLGSAIFHPEGSRVTFLAAGSRRGFAQSIYQVGGNTGNALAPVFTALIFVPFGQFGAIWFTALAALGLVLLFSVSQWYSLQLSTYETLKKQLTKATAHTKKRRNVIFALSLLIFLVFARSWYHAGISNYYQFYLIEHYHLSIKEAQFYLFIFMIAGAIGTFFGGPLADRFGKRNLILASTLGTAPFSIILPHLSLTWAWLVVFLVGFILSLSFSTLVIYAQELLPGNIGMASGLIVGLAFGLGAIGSVFWGNVADHYSLTFLMFICSFLPLLGVLTWLLPSDKISHH